MYYKPPLFIKIENFLNKIWNIIYNNTVSNWLKEHLWIQMAYPTYLYCDNEALVENGMPYVRSFGKVYQQPVFWKRIFFRNFRQDIELTLATLPEYALDIQSMWWWQKKQLLKDINKFWNGDKIFRYKRILTYN